MPFWDRVDATVCRDPGKEKSPTYVTKECDHHSGKQEENSSLPSRSIKFTQKKGNHHCGLKGSDAAARFVYAQQAAFDFNDVSMLHCCNLKKIQKCNR